MSRDLAVNVLVLDEQENPVLLTAGKPVPAKYADQVGDHCFGATPAGEDTSSSAGDRQPGEEPPRKGKGSGKDAWQAFASEKQFALDGDPGRDEIVELMVDAGLIKAEQ